MKKKRLLHILLPWIIVLLMLPIAVFATSHIVIKDCLSVSDNKNKLTASDGVYTATGAGGLFSGTTNTVTITNNGSTKANITFDFVVEKQGAGYQTNISGNPLSGTANIDLSPSGTHTMTISGGGALTGEGVLKLSNFTYTPIIEGPATITYSELGSVTVGGVAFTSGSTTGTITEAGVALVATPNPGAEFVAWVKADTNEVISLNPTHQLKPYATTMNIQAVFTTADQPAYYMTNSVMYNELNAAIAAASGGDKKVVVISSGTLPTGQTYTIPSGISLLVPYSDDDLQIDDSTTIDDSGGQGGTLENANVFFGTKDNDATYGGNAAAVAAITGVMEPDTSVTYSLTIPSSTILNVSGKFVVGGTLVAGTHTTTGICGATGGAHSNIQMDGTLNVNSGGVLSTCGYISGKGTVNAASGGTVYQPFVLMDHKDGHYLYAAKEEDRWPVYRYTMQNIRCKLVLNSGSDMYGYSAVFTRKNSFAAARFNPSTLRVVGSGEESALFRLNSGTLTMTYDGGQTVSVTSSTDNNTKGYYSKVGRTTMEFAGNAELGNIELSVVVLGSNYDMNSQNSEIPVPYNFHLIQKSGTFNVANNMALLPGSTFTVDEGAAMAVASGKNLVVYDGLRDYATRAESVTLDGDDQTGGTWPLYHYPTSDNLQSGGFSRTAELIVNGTLTVNGNLGGTVQTGGTTGQIVMKSTAGKNTTGTFGVQNKSASMTIPIVNITIAIAGSCGKTVRELVPQVFFEGKTSPTTLVAGGTYAAVGTGTNTINNYSYSVYASHEGGATNESKSNLNAKITGTWACAVHIYTEKVTTEPTCTASGVKTFTCSACGHSYTETISATGHNEVIDSAVAPTCTETGLTNGSHCSDCGEVITAQEVVAALGHTFDSKTGNCGTCGTPMATASIYSGSTTTYYQTLAAAVAAYQSGYIQMLTGTTETITTKATVYIDLNDCVVNLNDGSDVSTVYFMDKRSDGFTNGSGRVIGTAAASVQSLTKHVASGITRQYVKIQAADGGYAFPRVATAVTRVGYRADAASGNLTFQNTYRGGPLATSVLTDMGFVIDGVTPSPWLVENGNGTLTTGYSESPEATTYTVLAHYDMAKPDTLPTSVLSRVKVSGQTVISGSPVDLTKLGLGG